MERSIHRWLIVLVIGATAWFGWRSQIPGGEMFSVPWRFNNLVFVTVMFASIPATVLCMLPVRLLLAGGRGRAVWIVHPARSSTHQTGEPLEAVITQARARLEGLGFTVEADENTGAGRKLLFRKAKEQKVVKFTAHAFAGELTARREGAATHVDATLIFEDTVVVETGEGERLQALARYVAGVAPDLKVATLPFTMVCGVTIAIAQLGLRPVASLQPWLVPQTLSITLAAVGLILFGGYPILKDRSENHGMALGLLGLAAAVLPLLWR